MPDSFSFGEWVRKRRRALDLTQDELARRVGCAVSMVRKIELDERRPSKQMAALLASSLELSDSERGPFLKAARAEQLVEQLTAQASTPMLTSALAPGVGLPNETVIRTNLPVALTSFIGRESECATVAELLAAQRLVTLTGPGGTGKTRLTLRVASDVQGQFRDGVWLIELAPLSDPALVPQALANVLGLREETSRSLLTLLADYLRARTLLLVLDNCEHLVDACAHLAETLLRACPYIRILASSREALGVAGEAPFRVPPLRTPDPRQIPDGQTFGQYEAVRLFSERATSALPSFQITPENTHAIAQVCARLDGIPLAIELAAARIAMLRVEQIAARLDDRFRLLTGASRTAVPRQQTLRALIDWSYDLLSPPEQRLLQQLAVFAGGWTIEAAEAVSASGDQDTYEVLDLLTQLVNKSLVVAERAPGQNARYHMLETIRQYALEHLVASGAADSARQKHAEHFLMQAEQSSWPLQQVWLVRLRQERNNLQAAYDYIIDHDSSDLGLRLLSALEGYWFSEGYHQQGYQWAMTFLANQRWTLTDAQRAQALQSAGSLVWQHGDYRAARALLEESATISRQLDNKLHLSWTLNPLGRALLFQGEYDQARAVLDEAIVLAQVLGDMDTLVNALQGRGYVALYQADYSEAQLYFEQGLPISQSTNNLWAFAQGLNHLGDIARCEGEYDRAAKLYHESLARFQSNGILIEIPAILHNMGYVALAHGDQPLAQRYFAESLTLQQERNNLPGILESLSGFGALMAHQAQPRRAAVVFGAIMALRANLKTPMWPAEQVEFDRHYGKVAAVLEQNELQDALDEGRQLTLEELTAYTSS